MKSVFVTGSGQCGETFLNSLFKGNNKISARDESRPLLHSYYKFIKYNKINIDDAPLFNQLENVIKKSNKKGKIDFESSSFLALHIYELYNQLFRTTYYVWFETFQFNKFWFLHLFCLIKNIISKFRKLLKNKNY